MASEIGALCHIFRYIDVISAFTEVALLGATLKKALKTSRILENCNLAPMFFACSPLTSRWTAP